MADDPKHPVGTMVYCFTKADGLSFTVVASDGTPKAAGAIESAEIILHPDGTYAHECRADKTARKVA